MRMPTSCSFSALAGSGTHDPVHSIVTYNAFRLRNYYAAVEQRPKLIVCVRLGELARRDLQQFFSRQLFQFLATRTRPAPGIAVGGLCPGRMHFGGSVGGSAEVAWFVG
jgi:hypothetical protein